MTSEHISGIRNKMFMRATLPDGRTAVLCSWADGEWKVEIFASEAHARDFADKHNMEVTDARSTG